MTHMLVEQIMSKDIYYATVPGYRTDALKIMQERRVSAAPVIKKATGEVIGVISRTDLVNNPDEEQTALIMTREILTAKPDEDLTTPLEKMLEKSIRMVPVVENGELVGILSQFDIATKAIYDLDIPKPIDKYVLNIIPTIWEETPLSIAFHVMKFSTLKFLIALDENGKMSGIISETDFINESEVVPEQTVSSTSVGTEGDKWSWDSASVLYILTHNLKFSDKTVKDVATKDVITVTPNTSVVECAKIMGSKRIEQLPVTDIEGELLGILRVKDLIQTLLD